MESSVARFNLEETCVAHGFVKTLLDRIHHQVHVRTDTKPWVLNLKGAPGAGKTYVLRAVKQYFEILPRDPHWQAWVVPVYFSPQYHRDQNAFLALLKSIRYALDRFKKGLLIQTESQQHRRLERVLHKLAKVIQALSQLDVAKKNEQPLEQFNLYEELDQESDVEWVYYNLQEELHKIFAKHQDYQGADDGSVLNVLLLIDDIQQADEAFLDAVHLFSGIPGLLFVLSQTSAIEKSTSFGQSQLEIASVDSPDMSDKPDEYKLRDRLHKIAHLSIDIPFWSMDQTGQFLKKYYARLVTGQPELQKMLAQAFRFNPRRLIQCCESLLFLQEDILQQPAEIQKKWDLMTAARVCLIKQEMPFFHAWLQKNPDALTQLLFETQFKEGEFVYADTFTLRKINQQLELYEQQYTQAPELMEPQVHYLKVRGYLKALELSCLAQINPMMLQVNVDIDTQKQWIAHWQETHAGYLSGDWQSVMQSQRISVAQEDRVFGARQLTDVPFGDFLVAALSQFPFVRRELWSLHQLGWHQLPDPLLRSLCERLLCLDRPRLVELMSAKQWRSDMNAVLTPEQWVFVYQNTACLDLVWQQTQSLDKTAELISFLCRTHNPVYKKPTPIQSQEWLKQEDHDTKDFLSLAKLPWKELSQIPYLYLRGLDFSVIDQAHTGR